MFEVLDKILTMTEKAKGKIELSYRTVLIVAIAYLSISEMNKKDVDRELLKNQEIIIANQAITNNRLTLIEFRMLSSESRIAEIEKLRKEDVDKMQQQITDLARDLYKIKK